MHQRSLQKPMAECSSITSTQFIGSQNLMGSQMNTTTTVRTVVGHVVSVYRDHGVRAFQIELATLLERILEFSSNDPSGTNAGLSKLAYKLFHGLGLGEADFSKSYSRVVEAISNEKTPAEKCTAFRETVLSCLTGSHSDRGDVSRELAEHTKTYLKNCPISILRQLTTAALAERFGVTRSHLSRAYHMVFGRTLHQAITSERMNRAFLMLSNKQNMCTVKQAAKAVGYQSEEHFRAVFQRQFGFNPSHLHDGV